MQYVLFAALISPKYISVFWKNPRASPKNQTPWQTWERWDPCNAGTYGTPDAWLLLELPASCSPQQDNTLGPGRTGMLESFWL